MKKKSRFLTGLLSAVMALSLFALPATAADGPAYNATIDPKATGSITIHKYEKDGEDKKLLNGVEFTVYKVADIEQTTGATTELTMKPVAALQKAAEDLGKTISFTSETTYETIKPIIEKALKADIDDDKLNPAVAPKETSGEGGDAGTVTFSGLSVGVYLVVETKAPAQIVNKTANFLVSIPMVNAERTGWEYNIIAKPKNTPVYGGVTLYKYGKTAGDTGDGIALQGAKFILQQQGDNGTWSKVTNFSDLTINNSKNPSIADGILTTNADGMINIQGLAPGTYRFVEYSAPSEYITDGKTVYQFTVENSGNITTPEDNTYWDSDKKGIKVINEKPDLIKQVKTGTDNGNDTFGKASDYKLGDTVTWKVETKVPSTIADLETFTITDEMSKALDFTKDQQDKVKITTSPDAGLVNITDYVFTPVAADAENGKGPSWTLTFAGDGKKKLANNKETTVTVIFDTTLNDKAVTTDKGNLNDAKLEYSNAFYDNEVIGEHPNPGKESIKDQAVVYTFELNAVKMDGNDKQTKLSNAEFTLYRYNGTADSVTESDLKGSDGKKVFDLISDTNGQLVIKDEGAYKGKKPLLNNGTYYLVETKAPTVNGKTYNLLKEPVKVELKVAYDVKSETTFEKDDDGNVTSTVKIVTNTTFNDNSDKTGVFKITIYNKQGFDLPTTGGFGTLLFSGIGALLVVGGVGVLMSIKKKKGNV